MTLRSYLVLLVLGALLPILVFSSILVVLFSRQERAAIEDGLRATARALSVAVDRELVSSVTSMEALAASQTLETGNLGEFYRQAARVLPTQPDWYTIDLFEPDGRQLLNLREPFGSPLPGPGVADVMDVARTGRSAVSTLFVDRLSRRPLVAVAVPVRRDGVVTYVLAASIEPSALGKLLAAHQLPVDAVGTIIDGNGNVIARSRGADRFVGQPLRAELAAQIREVPEGTRKGRSLEGTSVYGAYSRSALSGWTVVLEIPAGGIDASLRRELWLVAGGGALLLLLGLGLASVIGRQISAPVRALSTAARALGGNSPLPRLPASAVREMNELTQALEDAAGLLRERARERQRAEERRDQIEADLRRANEAKDEFLAMLGHELRNPLGAVRNAIQALERVSGEGEQAARLRAIIDRQTAHLARLIGDLLDVSRVTSGKIALQRQPVDLAGIVQHSLEALRQAGKTERHQVVVGTEPAVVEGDRTRLEQIVANLLENAAKYTPPGGRIRVGVARDGGDAVLRVADSGVGIAPEVLPRIFDLFTQEARPLDRSEGGLGLGLTLVRRLTELHGGTVSASSAGRGRGSEFVVRLPLASAAAAPAGDSPAGRPARPLRVLVVEDSADARDALRLLLESWGYQVLEAGSGPSGVRVALEAGPDVALVDVGLPGFDGYAVARQLRESLAGRAPFLVALTGYGQPADRRRALDAGFDVHVAKPVDADQLAAVLAQADRPAMTTA